MKDILNKLYEHQRLTKAEAKEVLIKISENAYNDAQVASFITVYLMRSIDVEELSGFREALLELALRLPLEGIDAIDLCGTGGDGKDTFNISTCASFVVAGAGYKVVKHGNYGVSSISGSSNVLESLGMRFTNDTDILMRQLDTCDICFCHAPLFHPALKGVGHIRKQLGVKTFFNMLGPLVNPAQPNHQMVGVFNLKLAQLYQYIYQSLPRQYAIVHSYDGYDEISLTSTTRVLSNTGIENLTPSDFGTTAIAPIQINGGTSIHEAAQIFTKVLEGKGTTAQMDVVTANAACAIRCFKPQTSIAECMEEATLAISSGKALATFKKLLQQS